MKKYLLMIIFAGCCFCCTNNSNQSHRYLDDRFQLRGKVKSIIHNSMENYSDPNDDFPNEKYVFEFDERGRLKSEQVFNMGSSSIITYDYSDSQIYKVKTNLSKTTHEKISLNFKDTLVTHEKIEDLEGDILNKYYEYDKNGNRIREDLIRDNEIYFRESYEYSANHHLQSKKLYSIGNGSGPLSLTAIGSFKMDNRGNIIYYKSICSGCAPKTLELFYSYEFDQHGNWIQRRSYTKDSIIYTKSSRLINYY